MAPYEANKFEPSIVVVPCATSMVPTPVADNVASASTVSGPSTCEMPDVTVSDPPAIEIGSLAVMERTVWLPELIVMVGVAPDTSMMTLSLGPGTLPVLQLPPTLQSPLACEIHSTGGSETVPPVIVPLICV